ncbi:hypothetical protein PBI_ROLLINS_37 [Microbacterium phage Rollins]|uniref:Uncharacterized protein n=2 Tax=Armstrongvirus armstrong TaxID=2734217 RepID=A0A3G2KDC6_9CAUD|nr:hypothetical protein PBI_BERNSTEIN_37 [Microbacterium phage Bernstein]AYN58961.1 hypothetical protein PBI_ROLLINS_37 [Microbacterium phage Rollins]UGL62004.1 hypothetical protein SEA_SKYLORD_37 [Microbacterium phage Skylord]
MSAIDFSTWTDAQLEVGARFAATPADSEAIAAEQAKRAGTDDGSKARVDALLSNSRRPRRR